MATRQKLIELAKLDPKPTKEELARIRARYPAIRVPSFQAKTGAMTKNRA